MSRAPTRLGEGLWKGKPGVPGVGPRIELEEVSVTYRVRSGSESLQVLRSISASIEPGEFVALVGPTGCGKSTLLNVISGQTVCQGRVRIGGELVNGAPRNLGYMFQQDALLPWRTVLANVCLGPELSGVPRAEREARARELLALVRLEAFAAFYPSELSGGMRKRVALVQQLIRNPDVLLMDEPFAALDAQTRTEIEEEFVRIWQRRRMTVLFVTHDLAEAVSLADRVLVMSARPGRIIRDLPVRAPRQLAVWERRLHPACVEVERAVWESLREEAGLHRSDRTPSGSRPQGLEEDG